jgi:hypothetical protein
MWGFVPSFQFAILVAFSQQNPISALRKWKMHFSLDEMKIGLCSIPRHPKGTRVSDIASFRQTMP